MKASLRCLFCSFSRRVLKNQPCAPEGVSSVEHGVTGFIVEDEEEGLQAIKRLPELDRSRVRAGFERRFTARRMAEDYVSHYHNAARKLVRPSHGSGRHLCLGNKSSRLTNSGFQIFNFSRLARAQQHDCTVARSKCRLCHVVATWSRKRAADQGEGG